MRPSDAPAADVIIVGAGLAGATAAALLTRQHVRVSLIDRWPSYPSSFKAEKLEPDQIDLFRRFGLLNPLLPGAGRIDEIWEAENGRLIQVDRREQLGLPYHEMVNRIRATLPESVPITIDRVTRITVGQDTQQLTLASGAQRTCRLLVIASGTGGDLPLQLGMRREVLQRDQSLAFGFTLARAGGQVFPFDALTYYADGHAPRVAYLSLFRIGAAMRGNLFVCWPAGDSATRAFVQQPHRELQRLFPKLNRVIGEHEVVGRVESSRIDLVALDDYVRPGVVVVADAFQSVCPTTGMGLSKLLTDVDVLCHDCIPAWLSTPGMGMEKIARFYGTARKQAADASHRAVAKANREIAVSAALRWRLRRVKRRWMPQLSRFMPTSG